MYIKKTLGYVISFQNDTISPHEKSVDDPCRIVKCGRVLTLKEEAQSYHHKSVTIDSIANQGFHYYQVISSPGACETCEEHNGAIYPVAERKEGENLPPFHPNCKCEIQGFDTKNFNYDPWRAEVIVWLDIIYANILTLIADIRHIGKRMEEFFSRLNRANDDAPFQITPADLEKFGWHTATKDEANRLMAAFEKFEITSRESIVQFLAIAAAESDYGQEYLEIGNDAYWEAHGYNRNTRGAGYIQVTHDYNHQAFLDFIGDDYSGANTASYIAENYPLEVSVWFWSQLNLYGYEGGVNEFIETQQMGSSVGGI